MEKKDWNPAMGDFHKKSVHEDHKKFKKRAKIDQYLIYLFIAITIAVIIFGIKHF